MDKFFIKLIIFSFSTLIFYNIGTCQNDNSNKELRFELKKINPPLTITEEKLLTAKSIFDINNVANELDGYIKPSWIREIVTAEILTMQKGKEQKFYSKSSILTQEQKKAIVANDLTNPVKVKVKYVPENTLKIREVKEIDFTFSKAPEKDAQFIGGKNQFNTYLKEKAISKITNDHFNGNELSAIRFTIDEEGEIINAHVFESLSLTTKNEKVDNLLLETIKTMPRWEAARNSDGSKVKQDFTLTVGNLESCLINLINVY